MPSATRLEGQAADVLERDYLEIYRYRWPVTWDWLNNQATFQNARETLVQEGHPERLVWAAVIGAIMDHRLGSSIAAGKQLHVQHYFEYYEEHANSPLPESSAVTADQLRQRIFDIYADEEARLLKGVADSALLARNPEAMEPGTLETAILSGPSPDLLHAAHIVALAFGFMPASSSNRPLPFVALVFRNASPGKRFFEELTRLWSSHPNDHRDDKNIVVSFVDEPDGGYSFYLYPDVDLLAPNKTEPENKRVTAFPVYRKGFPKSDNYHRFRTHLVSGEYVLAGSDRDGNLFWDTMILKHDPRILRRDQVTAQDVEQPFERGELEPEALN